MIKRLNIRCTLHSHHVIEGCLLTCHLCLVVVALGLLCTLFQLFLAPSDCVSLPLRHLLHGCKLNGWFWDGRARRSQSFCIWCEVGRLIVLDSGHSANSRSLLFEDWVSHHVIDLRILHELLHTTANVVHLEDFGSRGSVSLVLCHKQGDEFSQLLAIHVWDGLWIILHNLENQAKQVIGYERLFQSAQFIQDYTKGPNVTLGSVRLTLTGFWRHIVGSTDYSHGRLCRMIEDLADSEVSHLDRLRPCNENVLRLDISMNNLATVDVLKSHTYLNEPVENFSFSKMAFLLLLSLDMVCQVAN